MSENNQTIYIGCDNGIHGGLAILQGRKIIELVPMPILQAANSKNEYDVNIIVDILKKYTNAVMIIEKAHAMPLLGTVQAFSFGRCYGTMLGIASALKIRVNIVHSKTWQREMFRDINSDNTKQASILIAKQLFPEQSFLATERSKKPSDGLTDAILIATYGQRHNL